MSSHPRYSLKVSKGQSYNLMKQGTLRRRSKLEIAEAKRNEAAQKVQIEQKLAQYEKMQLQLNQLQKQ